MTYPRTLSVTVSLRITTVGVGEEVPVEYEYEWEGGVRSRSVVWMTTENAVKEVQAHAASNQDSAPASRPETDAELLCRLDRESDAASSIEESVGDSHGVKEPLGSAASDASNQDSAPASDPFSGVPGTSTAAGGSWGNSGGTSNQESKP